MEGEILKQIFTEGGMIYLLFFMIVGGFIWKGIPYIAIKFENMVINFTTTIKEQQEAFKESLNKISQDFSNQIEKSNHFHKIHSDEIKEIKDILSKKK